MKEKFLKLLKDRRFHIVASLALILIVGTYIYFNGLSLDDGNHTFTIPEEIETAARQAAGDPAVPDTGVRETGYHIHVNLDTKQLYVYKDGQLIKTYPCSGGKASTPSPEGSWKVVSKGEWGEGFGGAWMGFNVPWGKYGIHGTVYPWQIGKQNGSEGCIRMLNKDVRELYKYILYGTTVTIIQENKSYRTMKSGDLGSDVKTLQRNLAKLGYYKGTPDGKYGSYLKTCVEKFQKDNKIYMSGKVDKRTTEALRKKVQEFEGNGSAQ